MVSVTSHDMELIRDSIFRCEQRCMATVASVAGLARQLQADVEIFASARQHINRLAGFDMQR